MSDVFISYARSTAGQAQAVAGALQALGYGVWRDDELPAHRAYAEVIEERLQAAKAVVVIWSAEAVKSEWVRELKPTWPREAGTLVQLRIDDASPPLPFNEIQCAEMAGWTGEAEAPGWRRSWPACSRVDRARRRHPPLRSRMQSRPHAATPSVFFRLANMRRRGRAGVFQRQGSPRTSSPT